MFAGSSKLHVKVTFIMSPLELQSNTTNAPQPDVSVVASQVQATTEKVENTTVIIERLGKVWNVIDVLAKVGDALRDV